MKEIRHLSLSILIFSIMLNLVASVFAQSKVGSNNSDSNSSKGSKISCPDGSYYNEASKV